MKTTNNYYSFECEVTGLLMEIQYDVTITTDAYSQEDGGDDYDFDITGLFIEGIQVPNDPRIEKKCLRTLHEQLDEIIEQLMAEPCPVG